MRSRQSASGRRRNRQSSRPAKGLSTFLSDLYIPPLHRSKERLRDRRLWMLYLVEAVTALATPMLIVSIYFYTEKIFGWSMRRNLLLAAAEGAVYIVGSLLASPVSQKFGRRRSVLALFILVGILAAIGALWPEPAV